MFKIKKNVDKKRNQNLYLAIDIGTHSIKTVLFFIKDSEVNVVGYNRLPQDQNAMQNALIVDINSVKNKIDSSIGLAIAEAKNKFGEAELPQYAIVGIAGELVSGVPIVVNVDRDRPDDGITQKELDNVIEKVKEHTFESTIDEIAEDLGFTSAQIVEIDSYIDSIYLDDVKVADPIGLRGSELKCKVFSTFAPKVHYDSIVKAITDLGLELKQIVVEPYALAMSLEGIKNAKEGGIFIDVGGGTTDVAIVENGEVMGTKMFAIGGRTFTKRIEKDLNYDYEKAEKMKIDYSLGKLPEYDRKGVKSAIDKDIRTWITGIEIALEEFTDVTEYPPHIYICGGGALLPEVMEELLAYPWMGNFNFKKNPQVKFYFPNKVSNINDTTKKARDAEDVTPLALARMGLTF